MATSKTGSFYLTESVTLTAAAASGTLTQGEIDLSAYVNVPTGQAIAIESVDFIFQNGTGNHGTVEGMLNGNGGITAQLTDLNPGTLFVQANDQALIASAALNIDVSNCIASYNSDLFPDNFGPANLSESFFVVNDTLYLVAGPYGANISTANVVVTARIRCRVVKLATKDWMAIAIQSTAES